MRYELSDYEWTAIKPMLPKQAARCSACAADIAVTTDHNADRTSQLRLSIEISVDGHLRGIALGGWGQYQSDPLAARSSS
jgi:hypothetical protein